MNHASLTGTSLHSPWHYVQETDPGTIGAGLTWFKKSTKSLKYRNDTNTGWITILASTAAGDTITTYHQVAPDTDWSGILSAYNSTDPGDTLVLANEMAIQESTLQVMKDIKIIGHPGGESELRILGNTTLYGTTAQFFIGWDFDQYPDEGPPADPAINVFLRNFKMSHSRTIGATRVSAIQLKNGIASIETAYMTFEDITADVVTQTGTSAGTDLDCHNVSFHHNVVDEWYESLFISRNGSLTNAWIYNNICTTTLANPNSGISRPYGFIIDEEGSTGYRSDIVFANNVVDARGSAFETMGSAIGLGLTINDSPGPVAFDRVTFQNNYVYNFYWGFYVNGVNKTTGARNSFITFENNHIENTIAHPIFLNMTGDVEENFAGPGDIMILAHNHVVGGGGGGTDGITIDITATPGYTVHNIANTWEA